MYTIRQYLLAVCLGLAATAGWAVELAQIDRSLRKEPAYQTDSPGYCLLVLGKDAATRVWMVVDGRRMYVDGNGNGDLTDDGDFVLSRSGTSFTYPEIAEAGRESAHHDLKVSLYDQHRFRLSIKLADGCTQTVGYGTSTYVKPRLAASPQEAPIIHLNGPMTFGRYGPVSFLPRTEAKQSYRRTWLRVFIGTPGLGEGTFAGYNCRALKCSTGYRAVTADVEYANRVAGAPPITRRDHLKVRG